MLTEYQRVKQEPGSRRRWFAGERLELIVWYDTGHEMQGFQLCFTQPSGERALTWTTDGGFVHSRVDAGDTNPLKNETPILRPDGQAPWAYVTSLFEVEGAGLEPELREPVRARLAARR